MHSHVFGLKSHSKTSNMKQLDSAQKKRTLYGMEIHEGSVPPPKTKKATEISFSVVLDECRKLTDEDWNTVLQVMKIKWPQAFENSDKKIELFSDRNMMILWILFLGLGAFSALMLAFTVRPEWFAGFLVIMVSEILSVKMVLRKEI